MACRPRNLVSLREVHLPLGPGESGLSIFWASSGACLFVCWLAGWLVGQEARLF